MQLTVKQTLSQFAETVVRGVRRATGRWAYSGYAWRRPAGYRARYKTRMLKRALAVAAAIALLSVVKSAVDAGGARILPGLEMPSVPVYFYQEDAAWAADTLGGSRATLGKGGDAVCCLASALAMRHTKPPVEGRLDPGTLNAWLTERRAYDGGGRLNWGRVARLLGLRLICRQPSGIVTQEVDKLLQGGGTAFARVRRPDVKRDHWVLLVGSVHGEYTIVDPLDPTGTLNNLGLYGNRVYELRYFR